MQFADLGLVVVDEQHRFGVEQRAALTDKAGTPPHVLVMTATPIPRTVAMTVFGDLEVSTLTELPGRPRARSRPTSYPSPSSRAGSTGSGSGSARRSSRATRSTSCARGSRATSSSRARPTQPDDDEDGEPAPAAPMRLSAAEEVRRGAAGRPAGRAAARPAPRPAGRPTRRTARCARFAAGEIDVLVATTVIEVGVDVANATTMVLLDADRFGVSQLHQLRGRVGRGGLPGPVPAGHPRRPATPRPASGSTPWPRPPTASSSAGSTSSSAARATCWAAPSPASAARLQNLRVLRDEKTIVEAREAAIALLADDPGPRPSTRAAPAR